MFFGKVRINQVKLFLSVILLFAFWSADAGFIYGGEKAGKTKTVVFVLDRIGVNDIAKSDATNIKNLIKKGGIGLMNVRGKAFGWENRETGYLSLGVGSRTSYPADKTMAGAFGRIAREKGLKIAVLDKTGGETPRKKTLLLAADEHGKVPYIATTSNDDTLFSEFVKFNEVADIIIVNYGENPGEINRADKFLGRVTDKIDMENTLFIMLTPNPSEEMIRQGNPSLTPVVMAGSDLIGSGILVSNTTKRPGLVANIDFAPTVFRHFGITAIPEFIGEPVAIKIVDNPLDYTAKSLAKYRNLKTGRYIIHTFYVTFTVLSMAAIYLPVLAGRRITGPVTTRTLACSVLTLPMAVYVLSPFFDFSRSYLYAVLIGLTALLTGYLINRKFRNLMSPLGAVSLVTGIVLLAGLFFNGKLYLDSPLGFADVFLGGRYYGMTNDSMGIMLGAAVSGIFVLFQNLRPPRWLAAVAGLVFTLPLVIGLTPLYGANVGGTIAAMVISVVTVIVLAGKKPVNWRQILFTVIAVFVVEVGIAYLDATFSSQRTHAGKVLAELLSGNFWSNFLHILESKLSLFMFMLVVPPWNLILLAEFYLVYKMFRRGEFHALYESRPYLAKGFTVLFIGGIVAFLFNDTGVIATAMMFTYLVIPLGIDNLLRGKNNP